MESKLKKITYLFISLLMALLLNNTLIFNNGAQTELNVPKQSDGYSESFIHVDSNWTETASTYGWCSGDGSWSTPFTIENVTIDASTSPIGSGILINNSQNAYFIVKNCTITNANGPGFGGYPNYAGGIKLINCSNGVIYNNTCADGDTYGCGILVYDESFNISISDNIVKNNYMHGIFAADSSYNLSITYNDVSYTTNQGIYFYNGCINNTIRNNNATNNGQTGIRLYLNCHNNTIIGNNASINHDGIFLYASNNNTIQGNIANDNEDEGIDLNQYCDGNRILGNIANNNPSEGIQLYSGSDFNLVSGNNVSNNNNGIRLFTNCDNNTILYNNASNNNAAGIYLNTGSDNNSITENTVSDNTDTGIYLSSSDNNCIKNNTINRNVLGIMLYYSDYNNISGNTLIDNSFCIYETYCEGNIIEYNDCSPPTVQEPIFIDDSLTGPGAHNWTWAVSQSWCSGSGTWNDPYIIENLKINGFGIENGIEIWNSDVSFIIQDCLINNTDTGIYLHDVNNARLINNNCSNLELGMDIDTCDNITISGNTANGNNFGIYLSYCDYNNITGNTANDNGESGIYLEECSSNTISGNTVNGNYYDGIYMYDYCGYNTISNNFVNNTGDFGISLHWYCQNNTIIDNIANYNGEIGIELYDYCSNNTISNNVVSYNLVYGIGTFDFSDNNILTENILYNNTIGVYIDNGDYNSIYENFFLNNGQHAYDDGIGNKWNSTIGNYWDNWTSPDVSPNDGIVDDPYTYIGGSAGSVDYLPIAEDGAPVIVINSPASSVVLGAIAPSFDVTITDTTLVSMWYTIDGGINNYTFIENGRINQAAWTMAHEGDVTITFYAKDIVGNEASESVTVVKTTAGLDPGIIIIIVVVSIVGGVALAAVIYLYLKKRPNPE